MLPKDKFVIPNRPRRDARYSHILKIGFIILLIFMAELFVYTWSQVQCVRLGYEISEAADQHEALIELQKKLYIELATLKSLDRIGRIALEKFNLSKPAPQQIILIQ
jgi:cell division protein FtsL